MAHPRPSPARAPKCTLLQYRPAALSSLFAWHFERPDFEVPSSCLRTGALNRQSSKVSRSGNLVFPLSKHSVVSDLATIRHQPHERADRQMRA